MNFFDPGAQEELRLVRWRSLTWAGRLRKLIAHVRSERTKQKAFDTFNWAGRVAGFSAFMYCAAESHGWTRFIMWAAAAASLGEDK